MVRGILVLYDVLYIIRNYLATGSSFFFSRRQRSDAYVTGKKLNNYT